MVSVIVDPTKRKTKVNRPPVPWKCHCGLDDVIVLPKLRGCLVFNCTCGRQWQFQFGPEGGDIHLIT